MFVRFIRSASGWVLALSFGFIGCSAGTGDSDSPTVPNASPGIGDGEMEGAGAASEDGRTFSGEASGPSGGVAPGWGGSAGLGGASGAPIVGVPPMPTDPLGPSPVAPSDPGILTAGTWDDNRNFERFLAYRAELENQQLPGLLPIAESTHRTAHVAFAAPALVKQTLDISLVIDTTGSMGDEIGYLQTEFTAISSTIQAAYPNSNQRWSLVVYRDSEDPYVVRWFDFRSDPEEFRTHLAAQHADGGGDFPEAPDDALAKMNLLAWRTDPATARLAFWVADAPHHDTKAAALAAAVLDSRERGIHLYPVASSGVDELTELSMRSAAQLTGGRYLFLTSDSGVGGEHKEPSIPCYFVTKLDRAILRMVDIELSGTYHEPDADEIVRTGGDPQDGACALESGATAQAF